MFPKIGVPQNGWFIMDDLGGFTPIFGNTHIIPSASITRNLNNFIIRDQEVSWIINDHLASTKPGTSPREWVRSPVVHSDLGNL